MPSTVAEVFAAAGAPPAGVVRWGETPRRPTGGQPTTGIYVVSLAEDANTFGGAVSEPRLSNPALDELLAVRPELTLDHARPSREELAARIAAFWFPDEVILYIGLAGPRKSRPPEGEVANRVHDYYKTPLGANGPHAGGWPLKVLSDLGELFVHYAYCDRVNQAEDASIEHFAANVSASTRGRLRDPVRVMPFANLEFPKGNPKAHGIHGARAPKTKAGPQSAAPSVVSPVSRPASDPPASTPHHRTQNVTQKDIAVGQVRIPIGATKRILPPIRTDVIVRLRGRELTCRWDPRFGEKERSGVLRVGKAAATELLTAEDVLSVSVVDGVIVLA
jgi:hypothetical protein